MQTHQIKTLRDGSPVKQAQELMRDNLIVKHNAGSIAYGTNLPTSDIDYRGIFCGDPIHIRTPFFPVYECEDQNEEDTKYYELAHFMKLCLECNPNIIETLWVDPIDIIHTTPAYEFLRSYRKDLLSSKIAFTTSGYALAQLKRIKGHNKWLVNPQPEEPPRQIDFISLVQWFGEQKQLKFHLEWFRKNYRLIPYGANTYGLIPAMNFETYSDDFTLNTTFEGEHHEIDIPLAVVKFNKEEYNQAKEKWSQYWTWKKNRNEVRSELEEQFGYDTKHAMHLVRLLRMGVEALRDGKIIVKRPDAQELLMIRNGAWTYEQVVEYAEQMDKEVREVWYKKTSLPKYPDLKLAAKILMVVQDMVWEKK